MRTYLTVLLLFLAQWSFGQCLTSYSWDYTPEPINGSWTSGEQVEICLIIDHDDWTGGNRYLHGVVPSFGSGWDSGTLQVSAPSSCSADGGHWNWYDSPVTGEASGDSYGPGFFYESPHGGTDPNDPGDNFGDRCPQGLQLEFCFVISVIPFEACSSDLDLSITVNTLSDDESGGSFLSAICTDDADALLAADINCCEADAGPDMEWSFCTDGPELLINDLLQTSDTGLWFYQSTSNPTLGDSLYYQPGISEDGTYLFLVTDTTNDCEDIALITLQSQASYSAGEDSSIIFCSGGGIQYLFGLLGPDADTGGSWTDPNGNPWQEPFAPSTDLPGDYTYSFPASGSCTSSSAVVEVSLIAAADAGDNSQATLCTCQGEVSLTSLLAGSPSPGGQWTDPEGDPVPDTVNPDTLLPGNYVYSVQHANCGAASVLDLGITFVGMTGEGGSFNYCREADDIDLIGLLSGTFDTGGLWMGPDGDTLVSSIIDASLALQGTYTYFFPCSPCGSTTEVELSFIESPTVSISGDAIQCEASPFDVLVTSDQNLLYDIQIDDDAGTPFLFENVTSGSILELFSSSSTTFTLETVTLDSYQGCEIVTGSSVQLTVSSIPEAVLQGVTNICPGQSLELIPELSGNGPFLLELHNQASGLTFLSDTLLNGEAITVYPSVNTQYSIINIWDSSDSVCTNMGAGIHTVNIDSPPSASMSGGGLVCGGTEAEAQVFIEGTWETYDIVISASFGDHVVSGVSDGQFISFPVPNSLEYCLSAVSPAGSTGCDAVLMDTCAHYEVLPNLITYSVQVDCDLTTQEGTVSFYVQGGSGTYTVNGAPLIGNHFTSEPMTNGAPFSFTIEDEQGCTTVRSGTVTCECLYSSAGNFEESLDTLSACTGEIINLTYDDTEEHLDVNDALSFIIHDGGPEIIGNVILYLDEISSGISYVDLIEPGEVYWLTAIVANETTSGIADINDVCLSTTSGVGILFYPAPSASLSGTAALCAGEEAEINVQLSGSGPWTVNISLDGDTYGEFVSTSSPMTISTSDEGEYAILSVSDAHCSGTAEGSVLVSVQDLPTASISGAGSYCEGSGNGPQVSLTGEAPWTVDYTIDGNPNQITLGNTPDALPVFNGGVYSLINVTDANCSNAASGSVNIDMLTAPTASLQVGPSACEGDSVLVSVEFNTDGPWQFAYAFNSQLSDTVTISENPLDLYFSDTGEIEVVYLTDPQCTGYLFNSDSSYILPLPEATLSLSDSSLCIGDPVSVNLSVDENTTAQGILTINDLTQSVSMTPDWSTLLITDSTLHIVLGPVTDMLTGCVDSTIQELSPEVYAYPSLASLEDLIICSGDTVTRETPEEDGVSYHWEIENGELGTPQSHSTWLLIENSGAAPIQETLTLSADRGGCISIEQQDLTIDPLPLVDFEYFPRPITAVNPVINLVNLTNGQNEYTWTLDGDTIASEMALSWLLPEDVADDYTLCLEAISINARCASTYCETIEVVGEMSIYIPNSFSPDGDGLNEKFGPVIRNADLRYYEFHIFDRGGSKVFSTDQVNSWWNGTEMNVGKPSRTGVYNYIITTRDKFRRDPQVIRGVVTLIR